MKKLFNVPSNFPFLPSPSIPLPLSPSLSFLHSLPLPPSICLHVPLLPSSSPCLFLFHLLSFSLFFSIIYIFRSYCWIHGTAYIRPHLQGKATGCFVDQSKIDSPEVRASWLVSHQSNWVFVTNSDFLMPIFFQTQVRKQLDI